MDDEDRPGPEWESMIYPDGSRYEGLMKDGQCHVRGVFMYSDGDKYAGEYRDNNMHGLGEYQWDNGTTYWGQWKDNQMHGCGVKGAPNNRGLVFEHGEWINDEKLADSAVCTYTESIATAAEARIMAERAKLFMFKPDGEVNGSAPNMYDVDGRLMRTPEEWRQMTQDPLFYPEGTEYLMPGAAGNWYEKPWKEIDEAFYTVLDDDVNPMRRREAMQKVVQAVDDFQKEHGMSPKGDLNALPEILPPAEEKAMSDLERDGNTQLLRFLHGRKVLNWIRELYVHKLEDVQEYTDYLFGTEGPSTLEEKRRLWDKFGKKPSFWVEDEESREISIVPNKVIGMLKKVEEEESAVARPAVTRADLAREGATFASEPDEDDEDDDDDDDDDEYEDDDEDEDDEEDEEEEESTSRLPVASLTMSMSATSIRVHQGLRRLAQKARPLGARVRSGFSRFRENAAHRSKQDASVGAPFAGLSLSLPAFFRSSK
mmetsp:Transcript_3372/g.12195  ORF Transcript_3372/g.12195 Transcript_3372/m.12195 type:complete len:484 (-) Transcript_3372:115-1566(-)